MKNTSWDVRGLGLICAAAALFAVQQSAHANYILSAKESGTGNSSVSVAPGGTFAVDFILSQSSGSDVNNSAVFQVNFSSPNLTETAYLWSGGYTTGTATDDSTPNTANKGGGRPQTPTTITSSSFSGPAGVVDIEMSNVLESGTFGTGTLVTVNFQVPISWAGPSSVTITAVPDTFQNGFNPPVTTTAGPAFTVNIPEPASIGLLLPVAGAMLIRRTRA
jgi:hypothetical protein